MALDLSRELVRLLKYTGGCYLDFKLPRASLPGWSCLGLTMSLQKAKINVRKGRDVILIFDSDGLTAMRLQSQTACGLFL